MARALVIDDSRVIRLILTGILTDLEFEVHAAVDGQAALDYLQNEKPEVQLMLVDWNMPGVNGLEFVRRVRTIPIYAGCSLMMVTTETEVEQMVTALDTGA